MPTGVYEHKKGYHLSEDARRRISEAHIKHGGCYTRLYRIWCNMKNRCLNPKTPNYSRYGGKGIYVIPKFALSFENFRDWALANGYRDDLTIDRIDSSEGYMPQNCQWIPLSENAGKRGLRVKKNG